MFELVELACGAWTLRSRETGETFHPVLGPEAEALALHVDQTDLVRRVEAHDRAQDRAEPFVIWDVGLGAAANALTVLRATRDLPGRTRLISFDHTLDPARFGFEHADRLGYFGGYESAFAQLLTLAGAFESAPIPKSSGGFQIADGQPDQGAPEVIRVEFRDGAREVEWCWVVTDFPTWISSAVGVSSAGGTRPEHAGWSEAQVIMYDAYSPARNPAMWTADVFRDLRDFVGFSPACSLATFSRSTMIRVTLLLAGFYVGIGRAIADKEETTMAASVLDLIERPLGSAWLDRVRASTNAEPLATAHYQRSKIQEDTWSNLLAHPQFCG